MPSRHTPAPPMHDGSKPPVTGNEAPIPTAVGALRVALGQLGRAIERLSDAQYARADDAPLDGTIGGHTRHCLDHVRALIAAAEHEGDEDGSGGLIDYDERARGTAIETDRAAALRAVEELGRGLTRMGGAGDRALSLRATIAADGANAGAWSTLGREAVFVLSHTVHHQAIIAGLIRWQGGEVEPGFGFAASTLRAGRDGREGAAGRGSGGGVEAGAGAGMERT